jgi:hypothetical protein
VIAVVNNRYHKAFMAHHCCTVEVVVIKLGKLKQDWDVTPALKPPARHAISHSHDVLVQQDSRAIGPASVEAPRKGMGAPVL